MEIIFIILAIIVGIILAIGLVAFVLFKYLGHKTKQAIGMDLTQAAGLIRTGFETECNTPLAISNMGAVYKPKLARDFPDVSYEQIESIAKNGIIAIFSAIEAGSTDKLQYQSQSLVQQVENVIADNNGKGITENYDNVVIHKAGISDYKRTDNSAKVIFDISLECLRYETKDGKIVGGSNTQRRQAVYTVVICYEYATSATDDSVVYSHNCPNCGAPIVAIGANKVCKYCGSGLTEISDRIWQINSYRQSK